MKSKDEILKIINGKNWTGYIWHFSDQNINNGNAKPTFYFDKEVNAPNLEKIQELYLYNGNDVAIHCKYLGEKEPVFYVNELSDFEDEKLFKIEKEKTYPSHLQKFGVDKVKFKTIYKKTETIDGSAHTWEPVLEFFVGLTKNH